MAIDFTAIKSHITPDHIISVMDSLGVPFVKQTNAQIIFYSICHHPDDFEKHKPKLYYYIETASFYCFVCGFTGDIFSLVKHIKGLSLADSVGYVCRICGLDIQQVSQACDIDQWQGMKKFLPNGDNNCADLPIYDKHILELFDYQHPVKNWIDDGISAQAMAKFGVGWYARNEQVAIPVFDMANNLVGIHARNTRPELVAKGLKYQPLKTLNVEYRFPTGKVLYGAYQNQAAIQASRAAILFEAPKSVMQMQDILGDKNISLAMFGWNCGKARRDILLDLGVNSIYIALDKQYQAINSQEFGIYKAQVDKIIQLFKPYCHVGVIWDRQDILGYKDSPSDRGADAWWKLWQDMTKI